MLDFLQPLDYPRQSLASLARGGGRIARGRAGMSDILGMLPGLGGVAAGVATGNPLLGALAAGGLHGLGKLTGLPGFDAPTTSDVVGMAGGDPESIWQNVLAQLATDPLTYAGAFTGGRAAAKGLGSLAAQAPTEGLGMESMMALGDAQSPVPPPHYLIDPGEAAGLMGSKGTGPAPGAVGLGEDAYQAAVRRQMLEDVMINQYGPEVPVPPGPPTPVPPGLPMMGRPEPQLLPQPYQGLMPAVAQDYSGGWGILDDMQKDMLAKGWATPEERLAASALGQELLGSRVPPSRMQSHFDVMLGGELEGADLPLLNQRELQAAYLRQALTETEYSAARLNPADADLNRLNSMAHDTVRGPEGPGGFGLGHGVNDLIRETNQAAGPRRAAQLLAEARRASPELRLAEQMQAEMTTMGGRGGWLDAMGPQETADAVARARQYGLPIDPQRVLSNYRASAQRRVARPLEEFLSAEELPLEVVELMRTQGANQLLRLLGPAAMQRLSMLPEAQLASSFGAVTETARKTGRSLTSALEQALMQRGLL